MRNRITRIFDDEVLTDGYPDLTLTQGGEYRFVSNGTEYQHLHCVLTDSPTFDYVKCPTGKDGRPIKFGETVYGEDGRSWKVVGYRDGAYAIVGLHNLTKELMKPGWLSHERPDTWGQLYQDMLDGYGGAPTEAEFTERAKRIAGLK